MDYYPEYNANIIVTNKLEDELGKILSRYPQDKIFLVTEENCDQFCVPLINHTPVF